MVQRSPSLYAGARIGGYELVRRIGRGGMAEVWCARRISERRASKFVALKVVADQYVGDPRFQRMFRSEAELSALLNHVNIVQVFDEGEEDGRSFLVMEWIDGVNLLKLEAALSFVDDLAWKHQVIAYIIGQLLHALSYAHSVTMHDGNPLGIVHRDVSPQNVLISNHGEVKLTDFGVAHHVLEESSGIHIKGKVRYMAPEQLAGKSRDPRVDLFAVGALLHELLDGLSFRHQALDQRELYIEVLSGSVPGLLLPAPPELEVLRRGLLEPQPERRIPTADAALELLERYPGYGDARRALTQLCGSVTGVLKPRVGPGRSGPVPSVGPEVGLAPPPSASPTPPQAVVAQAVVDEPEALPSRTIRMVPLPPGAPAEPMRNDTSPLPPPVPRVGVELDSTARRSELSTVTTRGRPDARSGHTLVSGASPRRPGRAAVVGPVLLGMVLLIGGATGLHAFRDELGVLMRREPTESRPQAAVVAASPLAEGSKSSVAPSAGLGDEDASAGPGRKPGSNPQPAGDADEEGETRRAGEPAEGEGERPEGGSSAGTVALVGAPPTEAVPTGAVPTEPAADGPRDEPRTPERPVAAPRRPRVTSPVSLATEPGLLPLEVRVGSKTYAVTKLGALGRVPVGKYTVKWRRRGESSWRDAVRVEIVPDCELNLKITAAAGLTPRPLGVGCK